MAVLYATGWEAGSVAWYNAQSPAAWTGNALINTVADYQHRNAAGTGGNYAMYQDDLWSCAAGTVAAGTARWLHFWCIPGDGGGTLGAQFGRSGVLHRGQM